MSQDEQASVKATILNVNGRVFLAGGHWSSPIYKKAPGNLMKTAAAERVVGKSLSAAFFQREQQIVFFSFPDKPKKGTPLAWAALAQIGQRNDIRLPFMGVFNLGAIWWFLVVDVVGNVLPGCDLVGSREEILGLLNDPDMAGTLNPFRENAFFLEDEKAAWQWLLEDLPRGGPVARPIDEKARMMAMGIFAVATSILVVGGGWAGWHWWQARNLRIERMKQENMERAAAMSRIARQRALAQSETVLQNRIQAYWANYPRPWKVSPTWDAFDSACEKAWKSLPENVDGWSPVQVKCVVNGKTSVTATVTWIPGALATVFHAPQGTMSSNGMSITQTIKKPIKEPIQDAMTNVNLPSAENAMRGWIGLRQEYAPEMTISNSPSTPFSPPVPSFVPPDQTKKTHSPELWQSFSVEWTSNLPPWSGWMVPDGGFVPGELIMNRSGGGWSWIMQGDQYAQP